MAVPLTTVDDDRGQLFPQATNDPGEVSNKVRVSSEDGIHLVDRREGGSRKAGGKVVSSVEQSADLIGHTGGNIWNAV
ncbi:hypothetical protein UCDDA912_g07117 [Diaporthe ampelina]|uniref:Uncharacterized protein n=1 Tax=Diaporthe ampelina TaxID=1214573 RepID=A0A0G2FED6_9PEZI|nr:hypothetical protein UCDDA912_g07117 [Diaporthe ampelina]